MKLKTTIGKLKSFKPCQPMFDDFLIKLREQRNEEIGDDTEISLVEILELSGICEAVWSLRTQEYADILLFAKDVTKMLEENFNCITSSLNTYTPNSIFTLGEINGSILRLLKMAQRMVPEKRPLADLLSDILLHAVENMSVYIAARKRLNSKKENIKVIEQVLKDVKELFIKHFSDGR